MGLVHRISLEKSDKLEYSSSFFIFFKNLIIYKEQFLSNLNRLIEKIYKILIISQIYNIGKAFQGNKTVYQVLVDSQKYDTKYFIQILINIDSDKNFEFSLVEYNYDNRYKYAQGLLSRL